MSKSSLREVQIKAFETLKKVLKDENSDVIHNEVAILLEDVFGFSKKDLILKKEEILSREKLEIFNSQLKRRTSLEPLAYVTNSKEFFSLDFYVTSDVLIPRRETELIVEYVLKWFEENTFESLSIVDIGCGSGAIILSLAFELRKKLLKREFEKIFFEGVDISMAACQVAKINRARFELDENVAITHSDLLSNSTFRNENEMIVLSNPPYISSSEQLPDSVQKFEPELALRAGEMGLDVYERIFLEIKPFYKEKLLRLALFEIGVEQSELIQDISTKHDFEALNFVRDLQGIKRIAVLQP